MNLAEFEPAQRLPDVTYELPERIGAEDAELVELFDVVVANLQLEASLADRPLTTFEQLLMERVAFGYVYMRHCERTGDTGSPSAHRQSQQFWLEVSKEFEARVKGDESERLARLVKTSFSRALGEIADPEVRKLVAARFSSGLAEQGL